MKIRFSIAAALTMLASTAHAQTAGAPLDPAEAFALTVTSVPSGDLTAVWDVQPGYYLYRSQIAAESDAGPIDLILPEGEVYDDPWMGEDQIYREAVATTIPAPQGPLTLHWQGCQQDGICYAPQEVNLDQKGRIIPDEDTPSAFSDWSGFSGGGADALQSTQPIVEDTPAPASLTLAPDQGIVAGLAGRGGALLVIAGFFGFGLLLSLTPCVLPMVPIVAGMLTRQGAGLTAARGLALTGAYVVAMAAAFGMLGVVAAWSGANLQAALQSPMAIGVIAAIFVGLALSMFGLFDMQMPAAWQARLAACSGDGGSLSGAAALGFGSALIVGPCITAPLAGALIYIAQTGDVVLGAAALFALGLGQGVPLLAVGAFGPAILPRRGAWMERVKLAFGVIFLGLAIWLSGRILPGPLVLALWAALLTGSGVAIGALDRLSPEVGRGTRMAAAAGVLLVFAGLVQGVGAALGGDDPSRPLAPLAGRQAPTEDYLTFQTITTQAGLAQALQASGPALIYVTADWCVICRAIERGPMADPQVATAMQDLVRIKVDVSDFTDDVQAMMGDLKAAGPPTLIFVDAARTEPQGSRLIGEMTADELLASVRQVAP